MSLNNFLRVSCLCMVVFLSACKDKTSNEPILNLAGQASKAVPPYNRYWSDLSRYLAGLEPQPGSVLANIENLPAAENHRKFFDEVWAKKEESLLKPLKAWTETEIKDVHNMEGTAYYPFSGADFFTMYTLFPTAHNYVFFGLEDEGKIPDVEKMSKERIKANLHNLEHSIADLMNLTFFKTKEMYTDLKSHELNGTIPILLAFVARCGNEVIDVKPIKISDKGEIVVLEKQDKQDPNDHTVTGVQIKFQSSAGNVQVLQYFSLNVSNHYFTKNKAYTAYIKTLEPTYTYIKAASYLMHGKEFSTIKNHLLSASTFILQDDSGMPLDAFDTSIWDLTFYGTYTKPIDLFKNKYQKDLFEVYQKEKASIKPLDFGIGYKMIKGTSNWMIARKKQVEKATGNP